MAAVNGAVGVGPVITDLQLLVLAVVADFVDRGQRVAIVPH